MLKSEALVWIEVDASKNILQQASRNLENVKQDSKRRENEIRKECDRMKKMHVEDEEKIADLEEAIIQNEKLRSLAITAIEEERTKTRMICEDLKNQREKAVDRADNCETRCNDLENEVGAERRRCDELRNNLEAEAIAVKEIRQKIDRDRREVEEAREKDRIQIHRLELQIEGSKRERAQFDRQRDEFEEEKVIMLKKIERMREDVCKNLTTEKSRREQNVRAERELRDKIQEQLDRSTIRLVNAERRIKELEGDLENERIDKDFEMKRALSSSEMSHKENVEPLLLHRRQLENIRQRLHTETSRLQRIISYNAQQSTQDPTQLDELKRTTQNLQQELRDLHTNLSLPKDFESEISTSVRRFNDRVLRHNARLAEEVASCVSESIKLRDRLVQVEADNERLRINHDSIFTDRQLSASNASKHKMAVRIHKLYFRYLRSESYRKALVYQKKYLLLLIGGFKDSEEATLALIAQMGAYPSDESLRRPMGRRSAAFTRFRSVVRVSIACSRMKFLVAKWGQASQNLSSCIESKHGVKVDPSKPPAVTASSDQDVVGDFPYLGGARATPTTLTSHRSPLATSSTASSQRYPITPHHHRHDDHHRSSSRSAALRVGTPSTGYSRLDDHLLGGASTSDRMLTHSSSGYLATASSFPTSNYRPSSSTRSREEDLEPPLKEYIRKLGNIQQKLSETTTPRYRR